MNSKQGYCHPPNMRKGTKYKRTSRASTAAEAQTTKWKSRGPNFSFPSAMVTFYVGKAGIEGADEETAFSVHKEFTCHHSPVLDAAFNSSFIEGETQTYRLDEIDASAFQLLVQWFYNEDFVVHTTEDLYGEDKIGDPEIDALWAKQDEDLVQLWIVADKLLMPKLQNTVITKLQESWLLNPERGASTAWIPYAYEHTSEGSPLRALAVDQCAWVLPSKIFVKTPEHFPREMLLEYAFAISDSVEINEADHWEENNDGEDEDDDEVDNTYNPDQQEEDEDHGSSEEEKWGDGEGRLESDDDDDDDEDDMEALALKYNLSHVTPNDRYTCKRQYRSYLVPEKRVLL